MGMEYKNDTLCLDKLDIGVQYEQIEDPEGRSEITTDVDDKIISYRDAAGVKHENVGIETKTVNAAYLKGNMIDIGSKDYIYVDRPKFADIYLEGILPIDLSDDRIPTKMKLQFVSGGISIFTTNVLLSIQGNGSVGVQKHNYTIDFLNDNDEELSVKFGDMIAVDSFHLKSGYFDRSHTRNVACPAIWRDMIKLLYYPYSKINNKPYNFTYGQNKDEIFISDAKYSEDGFPVSIYLNGDFYGLYTLKLKKTRQNYAMEKNNKSEIFLDSITTNAFLHNPFNHEDWELKNPKIKGYEEGGEITDAGVLANIERLFDFTSDLSNKYQDHEEYIVLKHWLVYVLFCELIYHMDTYGNNTELLTWDATHWSILPYDMDNTVGLYPWPSENSRIFTTKDDSVFTGGFFAQFKILFHNDLSELYTKLKKTGFIEVGNLYSYFVRQSQNIPRDIQNKDMKKWDNFWKDGNYPVIEQIYPFLYSRIQFLDNEYLTNV